MSIFGALKRFIAGPPPPVRTDGMAPLLAAMRDAMSSGTTATFHIVSDLGNGPVPLTTDRYLKAPESELDTLALSRCKGRVLDIGAGCGRYALELQRREIDVVALDRSAGFIEILDELGVEQRVHSDIYDYTGEEFDTLLLLDHTAGIAESPDGLVALLEHLHTLTRPGGELLIDGIGAYERAFYPELPFTEERIEEFLQDIEPYFPISTTHYEYASDMGESFSWIYPGESLLAACAARTGWTFELLIDPELNYFLASLRRE